MSLVVCKLCKKVFNKKPSQILLHKDHYCSAACSYASRKKGKIVICEVCGIKTYKIPKALNGSKSGKFFCGKSCQTKWRNRYFSGNKHPNFIDGKYAYRTILKHTGIKEVCLLCETKDKRVLAAHHIDLNHSNNNPQNLAWLCHNCHFLVHHDKLEKQRFLSILKSLEHMVAMV